MNRITGQVLPTPGMISLEYTPVKLKTAAQTNLALCAARVISMPSRMRFYAVSDAVDHAHRLFQPRREPPVHVNTLNNLPHFYSNFFLTAFQQLG